MDPASRPRGHSGVHSPRVQNADGPAFLVDGRSSRTGAPATWTARERRRSGRPADHHRRGLARRVRARTGRRSGGCPASQARLLPQHRCHVARAGRAGGRGNACHRCRSSRLVRSSKEPRDARSRLAIPDQVRLRTGSTVLEKGDDHVLVTLHASARRRWTATATGCVLVCRGRCVSRDLAPGRDGVNGDARRPTRTYVQDSLRIYRWDHYAHHSRRPGAVSPRSSAALRAMALRLARRR